MDKILLKSGKSHRIGFLLIDQFAMMSYAATLEPLRAANHLSGEMLYQVEHLSEDDTASYSSAGMSFPASMRLDDILSLDILFVVAGGNPGTYKNERVFAALRKAASRGVILGGVSAGPYILAMAGLMNDHRMTVHWEHSESLIENNSNLLLSKSLYVMDRNRFTCAGGTAPLDMMHALITNHHGTDFARKVSDWFMHTEVRPASGQQRAGLVERYQTTNSAVIKTIELMENNLATPMQLERLAELCNLSSRQLNRLFKTHIRRGTMQFYLELRLEQARKLCEETTLSITEISLLTGFNSLSHFSAKFSAYFSITPSELRLRQ